MELKNTSYLPEMWQGFDISCTDGGSSPPETTVLSKESAVEWLECYPSGVAPAIRLLGLGRKDVATKSPITQEMISAILWKPDVYDDLAKYRAGGCAALLDEPYQFVIQTPSGDGGPFVSVALSRSGIIVKGTYVFDDDIFHPMSVIKNEKIQSGWRSTGLQIISVPQAIVKAQSQWLAGRIEDLCKTLSTIERSLAQKPVGSVPEQISIRDFSGSSRLLQSCSSRLIDLERRSRWETQVLDTIETVTIKQRHATLPWPALAPLRAAIKTRQFDFETLPRRVANARATISNLMQEDNDRMNLEIAKSSHQIVVATLSESAAMKTIAIMTMIFLPGTAIASFFSMGFFTWDADSGGQIASKWLWVFFVTAIPMSAMVLVVWWYWTKRSARMTEKRYTTIAPVTRATTLLDEECAQPLNSGGTPRMYEDDIKTQKVQSDLKNFSREDEHDRCLITLSPVS